MEKMKMETPNITDQNIEKIGELFPNCVTEGKDENGQLKKLINFDMLKQMLSGSVTEGKEVYEFTWPGKKEAIIEANMPIRKTLRPCKEESKNWDTTENLYIEGDNLEILKLLQESYLGKVKMLYLDPPYNTGKNLIYKNNFYQDSDSFSQSIGQMDADNNRLFANTRSNGRFHSDWCSMIYPRLILARNLLSKEGIICLTIDDSEIENVTAMMNEVFGEENYLATIVIKNNPSGRSTTTGASIAHEYALFYGKSANLTLGRLPRSEKQVARFSGSDDLGPYEWRNFKAYYSTVSYKLIYPIYLKKDGSGFRLPKLKWDEKIGRYQALEEPLSDEFISLPYEEGEPPRMWKWSVEHFLESMNTDLAVRTDAKGQPAIYFKFRMKNDGVLPISVWDDKKYSSTENGTNYLMKLLGKRYFDYPKSIFAVNDCLLLGNLNQNDIIMDLFSGSSTTAEVVMEMNAKDGGNRSFVMVQLPEKTDSESLAYKDGLKNICEIGKERIRRAGEKIKAEHPEAKDLDIGFRVLKVDSSNMNDVYYAPDDYSQGLLDHFESNIKEDRSSLDLLFGCLLDWGLPLSLPYTSEEIGGFTVHNYNDGDLIACFDENISDVVIKEIAKRQPLRAVFRDSSFESNPSKINVSEIFKMISPDSTVKVI